MNNKARLKRAGRKAGINAAIVKRAGELRRAGLVEKDIYSALSIACRTFYNWKARGSDESDRMEKARVEYDAALVRAQAASETDLPELLDALEAIEPRLEARPGELIYLQFWHALTRGRSEFKLDMLTYARAAAAKKDGRIALQLLAMADADYREPPAEGLTINNSMASAGGTVTVVESRLTPEDYHAAGDNLCRLSMQRRKAERERAEDEEGES